MNRCSRRNKQTFSGQKVPVHRAKVISVTYTQIKYQYSSQITLSASYTSQ